MDENLGANSSENAAQEASPAVETSPDGLIGTVDIADQSEPQQPKGESEGGENERYDKIPRFQELKEGRDKALEKSDSLAKENADLKQSMSNLEGQVSGMKEGKGQPPKPEELPFKNIADMNDDDLREWQADDPKGYAANILLQAKHELSQDFEQKLGAKDRDAAIDSTFKAYGDKNPDFWDKWNSGETKKFMKENPGHNAISAHQMLTSETRDEAIRTKTKEKLLSDLKTKGNINSLGPSGTFTPDMQGVGGDAMKNPEKHGGETNVLLQRHNARLAGNA